MLLMPHCGSYRPLYLMSKVELGWVVFISTPFVIDRFPDSLLTLPGHEIPSGLGFCSLNDEIPSQMLPHTCFNKAKSQRCSSRCETLPSVSNSSNCCLLLSHEAIDAERVKNQQPNYHIPGIPFKEGLILQASKWERVSLCSRKRPRSYLKLLCPSAD